MPNWIPCNNPPSVPCNIEPPTDNEICAIVNRMKSSGSPCPIDQISVICFKRCAYLRSYLHLIFKEIWQQKYLPMQWSRAVTILIHKKGETSDPSNFRPITLESVALKIFTSLIRDRMYTFLIKNEYIESNIHKGFVPGMSGTYEHLANLTHIINHARKRQRSLSITLIDLRNAF